MLRRDDAAGRCLSTLRICSGGLREGVVLEELAAVGS
jgi:exopolyphosphatase/pppGpp-phosphohydrolase